MWEKKKVDIDFIDAVQFLVEKLETNIDNIYKIKNRWRIRYISGDFRGSTKADRNYGIETEGTKTCESEKRAIAMQT